VSDLVITLSILLAGRDTTATLMSYALQVFESTLCRGWLANHSSRFLTRHPSALQKLRNVIRTVLGQERATTRAHIQRMPYLHVVINESKSTSGLFIVK
jgi:hypothetical protein